MNRASPWGLWDEGIEPKMVSLSNYFWKLTSYRGKLETGRRQTVGISPGTPTATTAQGKIMQKAEFVYGNFHSHLWISLCVFHLLPHVPLAVQ